MAFRLQSFLAGAAKEATKNIRALDEEYRDSLKNTAADLAKEAKNIRKARMTATLEYGGKARKLQRDFGLSDGQIQTILSSGTDSYDSFVKSIQSGQAMSKDPTTFDAKTFAQTLFAGEEAADGILSLEQQAQAYGARMAPSTLDLQTAASGISAGTQTMLTGISTEDVAKRLRGSVGDISDYTGPAMGDTGLSVSGLGGMSASDIIAFRQAQANLQQTGEQTKGIKATTELTGIRGKLIKAQTTAADITNKVLPEQLRAEIDKGYASTALTQAQTEKVEQDTTKSILETTKLNAEIKNYQKFGAANEQAALDLLEAKIVNTKNPANLEALQATLVNQANEVRDQAASLPPEDQTRDSLIARANALDTRAAGVANMITAQDATTTTDWSKGSPEKRFASLLKNNVQSANISGSLNSAGDWQWDFSNKRPAYYTALANTTDQYEALYGASGNTGRTSSAQNYQQLENTLRQWSQEGTFAKANQQRAAAKSTGAPKGNINFGVKTREELKKLATSNQLQPGDIATIRDSNGIPFIAMYGTQGEWVSAGDF